MSLMGQSGDHFEIVKLTLIHFERVRALNFCALDKIDYWTVSERFLGPLKGFKYDTRFDVI